MFEQFSNGYYLGRLYVEPTSDKRVRMCRDQHEWVNRQLYTDTDANQPLVMKLGSKHLAVHAGEGVPADTLSVPESVLEETDVRNPPSFQEVLLAKADRADQLLSLGGAGR